MGPPPRRNKATYYFFPKVGKSIMPERQADSRPAGPAEGGNHMATINGTAADETLAGTSAADTINGLDGADRISGGDGADTIDGGNGTDIVDYLADGGTQGVIVNLSASTIVVGGVTVLPGQAVDTFGATDTLLNIENIRGTFHNDTLYGNDGANSLDGVGGADTLVGGGGNDIYFADSNDTIIENAGGGIDEVRNPGSTYVLPANVENLWSIVGTPLNFTGNELNNVITTGSANDSLTGLDGDDTLIAGAGADTLSGGNGNDVLTGGVGADSLTGGAGADTFKFATGDSGTGGNADRITDFGSGDLIDLSAFDANSTLSGTQTFNNIGSNAFSNTAGELRYYTSGSDTIVEGDTNGDGVADFQILLTGAGITPIFVGQVFQARGGAETFTGGPGFDTLTYAQEGGPGGVIVNLSTSSISVNGHTVAASQAYDSYGATDTFSSIESLIGTAHDDFLHGGYVANSLYGGDGNDTLETFNDNAYLVGGNGNDYYILTSAPGDELGNITYATLSDSSGSDTAEITSDLAQISTVGIENIVLDDYYSGLLLTGTSLILDSTDNVHIVGGSAHNSIFGGSGNDTIEGGDGDDTLLGGAGADVLNGGAGVDEVLYWSELHDVTSGVNVDLLANTASGAGGEANGDTFVSIENVFGTNFVDSISGDNGNNTLGGFGGDDTLEGYGGDDILQGGDGNDALIGDDGNDTLDGGAGADDLQGNLGNDIYIIDNAGDLITEFSGEGTDEVRTSLATYALPSNVSSASIENLTGTSSSGQTLTGNSLANVITAGGGNDTLDGSIGADTLNGGAGNDTYVVDNAGDVVNESASAGTDLVRTTLTTYTLGTNVENLTYTGTATSTMNGNSVDNVITGSTGADTLNGNGGNDTLIGNAGNDTLNGGAGDDTMTGGAGNDTYFVDSASDVVTELAGEGSDTVRGSVATYSLPNEVENFIYTGSGGATINGNASANSITGLSGADTLSGGDGNDTLTGAAGADTLSGGNGNDTITGGTGADTLTGGANVDTFIFSNGDTGLGAAADRIQDFVSGTDKINLAGIDANTGLSGDQAFTFLGSGAFTGVAGQLHYVTSGSDTLLQGDTNGDGVADFTIILTGTVTPVAADFVL